MDSTRRELREVSARKLALKHDVVVTGIDGVDATLITIPKLADISRDRERWADSFLYLPIGSGTVPSVTPEWRRILTYNETNKQVAVNRVYGTNPISGDEAQVYLMLNPDEWDESINDMLTKLYFHVRDSIAIVDDQTEYDLASWVQHKGMVVDVRYRNTVTGNESALPRFRLDETGNKVVLHLLDKPWSSTTFQIIVECKRFYWPLTTDATSTPAAGVDDTGVTTCPEQLWQPAVVVSAIHKLYNKYGDRMKKLYAQDLAIAERDYMVARAQILPTVVAREYAIDEDDSDVGFQVERFYHTMGWA